MCSTRNDHVCVAHECVRLKMNMVFRALQTHRYDCFIICVWKLKIKAPFQRINLFVNNFHTANMGFQAAKSNAQIQSCDTAEEDRSKTLVVW